MDLALLRTFVTVHRAGSFTRAAALLGLSQPAVTSQIRTLERQLGRPLFLRQARGVTPTTIGDELAHKAAPHLDALVEIAETGLDEDSSLRTLHLAGPPEFTAERALPALTELTGEDGMGFALRASFGNAEETLEGLAAGHHDLAITTARPRGTLLTATPLCDEEHVLVAAPRWAARIGAGKLRRKGSPALENFPVVEVHESLPLVARYWASVFDSHPAASGTVVVPDLRAVLACAATGAGLAVLPRYLCAEALERGDVVALLDPAVPPLRTYFLVVRTGTLAMPHIARAHDWLLHAAADWS
ncbi:LysR family transcriptional regulator [Streptomyces sp. NBC_01340]|jgi:DNA-binding transcriptional LysR family regulator|uniref:LysR family transcriptional regulator n=1 Tax=unclassified Streptomyces TaxID=2593676 RepID=UPI00225768D9|nr:MULTISPECIES: LysR family transcriptional regulator [unclassified Streptomyces]MCX4455338.1 LysR family transcriptional regulator [Streptomyces sp. NBC_01719]MCX4494698.1 LysR family transcriptional regulator [Streptomyces sp. NBC_01728]MCX4590739.1 LysR family transcriptional regulator [Streptomyces sp. NBC_01549]MCX5091432.1 LysR family transcriptional regulator [Streptomyces sp. NBC_00365]WSI39726.1 LysR family transcriptional regulator [Streptomyces sp. NBC_01340]